MLPGRSRSLRGRGVRLTPEAAAEVTARTEGWPAGLYLAAQLAAESGSSTLTVSGDDRQVADYLHRESLANQPDDVQRFLQRTAVLDHLGGPLCDAVLETSDSAERLRRLEASSLFVVPLHRQREWYRYHALFQEFLLAELRRREPGIVDGLHRRAADWYESNGAPAMAVEHLLRTVERHRAAQLATESAQSLYNAGRLSTLQRWLATLGDEEIAAWPPLAVNACVACALMGDTVGSERWAAMVESASFDLPPWDGSASFESARAMLRALMCPNGPQSMLADATLALAEEPPWSLRRPNVLWLLAEAHLVLGDVDEAGDLFEDASTASIQVGIRNILIASQAELGRLPLIAGTRIVPARCVTRTRCHRGLGARGLRVSLPGLRRSRPTRGFPRRRVCGGRVRASDAPAACGHLCGADRRGAAPVAARGGVPRPQRADDSPAPAPRDRRHPAAPASARNARGRDRATAGQGVRRAGGWASPSPLTHGGAGASYLQTHLTFAQIAERLFISRNTVATHVHAIYRSSGLVA